MSIEKSLESFLLEKRIFASMFDTVRLIEQDGHYVCKRCEDGHCRMTNETCFSIWGKKHRCANCISHQAYVENRQHVKFEYARGHYYFVIARPIELDGKRYVLECVIDVTHQFATPSPDEDNFIMNLIHELEAVSSRDPFSGLYNKTYFTQHLSSQLNMARKKGEPLYLALWDLNRFKRINDTYGHDAGDRVLIGVSKALQRHIQDEDGCVARFGGDEFAILFHLKDRAACKKKLKIIQDDIASQTFTDTAGNPFHITASFGLSDIHNEADASCAIHRADTHLYHHKEEAHQQEDGSHL